MPHNRNNITVRSESNVIDEFLSTHGSDSLLGVSNEERLYKKGDRVLVQLSHYLCEERLEGIVIGYVSDSNILVKFNPQEWSGHNGGAWCVGNDLADIVDRGYNGEYGFWVVKVDSIIKKLDSHKEFMVGDRVVIINKDIVWHTGIEDCVTGAIKGTIVSVIERNGYEEIIIGSESKEFTAGYGEDRVNEFITNCCDAKKVVSHDPKLCNEFDGKMFGVADHKAGSIKVIERNGKKVVAKKKSKLIMSTRLKKFIKDNARNYKICELIDSKQTLFTETINYLSVDRNGACSFIPNSVKQEVNSDGKWKLDKRQKSGFWRAIRPVLELNGINHSHISNADVEALTNAISASFYEGLEFQVRTDVIEVYCMDRAGTGTLGDSCMNGDSDLLDLYNVNSNINVLALIDKEGKLQGRALIWDINHKDLGQIQFLDRFYVAKDWMCDKFIAYAKENNLYYKVDYTSYSDKGKWINPSTGKITYIAAEVEVNATELTNLPYVDTFTYMSADKTKMFNYEPQGEDYLVLDSTDGSYEEVYYQEEDEDDDWDSEVPFPF